MKKWQKTTKKLFIIAIVVLVVLIVMLIGSATTQQNIDWYQTLNKPLCVPPTWAFSLIWSVLYILITASVIIVLFKRKKNKKKADLAIGLFLINAIFNILFSLFFFGLRSILLAFIELPLLLASILLLIWACYKISKVAAYLLIPYLVWVCYATVLTGIILFIN